MAELRFPFAVTEYPNSFTRQGAFPLDNSTVIYNVVADAENNVEYKSALDVAKEYAQTSGIAYVGQILSVVEVGINSVKVDVYKIDDEAGNISKVGDDVAITQANAAIAALQERIAQAENRVTTLEEAVNGKGEGEEHVKGLTEKVADNAQAISGHNTRIGSLEGKVSTLETTGATKEEVATAKSEAIEAAVTRILDGSVAEDFDTLKEVAEWITSHTSEATELINRLTAVENDYLKGADKTELTNSINALITFVGTLPESATSTNVVAYISEAIAALNIGDYAKASALQTLSETVTGISTKVDKNAGDISTINQNLENKVDKVEGSRLINSDEIEKLSKLTLQDGELGVSGTVAAGNVTGLPQRIADIFNSTEEGAVLNEVVKARHIDSNLVNLINGAVQTSNLNTAEFKVEGNTLNIHKINVNKLEQTEGEWLILNGGDANNTWE